MENYLESIRKQFKYYENLGFKTINQVSDEALFAEQAADSNSIAIITQHLHGNMLSRWTDFLHTDGEKDTRDRDGEFEGTLATRQEVENRWKEGWECLFEAITPLTEADLDKIVYIRNQGHTVMEAINRQLCHYSYHVGQIVMLGKIAQGSSWESLSIPKGSSKSFNQDKFSKPKKRGHFTD